MLSISPSLILTPPHLLAPFQCQSLPSGHSQSVKKTWAALYLEVGGSLKSLIREWMDWKREGAAGLGRKALWASLLAQGELCTSIPSPHWSQDTPHGHSCPSQHLTQVSVPHCTHLLGGGDEIHGLQAGQRLPALVDVFHNLGGKTGIMAGRAVGRALTPGWLDIPWHPLHIQNTPRHSSLPTQELGHPCHPIPACGPCWSCG